MTEWISPRARLPEPFETVLIAVFSHEYRPYVTVGGYNHLTKEWESYTAYDRKLVKGEEVLSWSPLPKAAFPASRRDGDEDFFDKEETFTDCTVQILTNTRTGAVSVGWWRNGSEADEE